MGVHAWFTYEHRRLGCSALVKTEGWAFYIVQHCEQFVFTLKCLVNQVNYESKHKA